MQTIKKKAMKEKHKFQIGRSFFDNYIEELKAFDKFMDERDYVVMIENELKASYPHIFSIISHHYKSKVDFLKYHYGDQWTFNDTPLSL